MRVTELDILNTLYTCHRTRLNTLYTCDRIRHDKTQYMRVTELDMIKHIIYVSQN